MQQIEPCLHFNILDFVRCTVIGIYGDSARAFGERQLFRQIRSIVMFRLMQYSGVYAGHRGHLKVSEEMKQEFSIPNTSKVEVHNGERRLGCAVADESK